MVPGHDFTFSCVRLSEGGVGRERGGGGGEAEEGGNKDKYYCGKMKEVKVEGEGRRRRKIWRRKRSAEPLVLFDE